MKKLFIHALLALALAGNIHAQQIPAGTKDIYTESVKISREGKDSMKIEFNIRPKGIRLSSNEQMVITPLITDHEGNMKVLPPVIVNGRRKDKAEKRLRVIGRPSSIMDTPFQAVRAGNGGSVPALSYRGRVKAEPWMETAGLYLQTEFCGCGRNGEETLEYLVAGNMSVTQEKRMKKKESNRESTLPGEDATPFRYRLMPYLTFMEPERETVKRRTEVGTAYITYMPGSAEIEPSLAGNREELEKITRSMLMGGTMENGELAVTKVSITSFSSPEGPWESNLRLSEKRAGALKMYVMGNHRLPASCQVTAKGVGEDWDGLERLVSEGAQFEGKAEAIRIIKEVGVFQGREKQLMDLAGGRAYRYMLSKHFPLLRRSEYRIEYTVPQFELAYGKEVLEHRPGMLSHHELYTIAFSYPPGSELFNRAFRMARTLFPTDRISQFNMAAVYMLEGNIGQAEKLLEGFGQDPRAWNNLGVLYMMQGRYSDSHAYLNRAIGTGNREAEKNLEMLERIWKKTE